MEQKHSRQPDSGYMEAFKQLFDAYKKPVFAIALSILKDTKLSEDVLQETFLKLFQHMKQHEIANVKAWLIHVARNIALDLYRKKKHEITVSNSTHLERAQAAAEDPLDRLVLSKYLALLDDEERQIVILKNVLGIKHREIAKLMELPLGTVLWKYNRALRRLRKSLEEVKEG